MTASSIPQIIDVHSHVVPDRLVFSAGSDARWPRLEHVGDQAHVYIEDRLFRVVGSDAWDMDVRMSANAAAGLHHQVISPMPELFCYWADAIPAEQYCAAVNEHMADTCRRSDGTLSALGIVPLQDVPTAIRSLHRVRELGLRGIEVGTNVEGTPIFDERFSPIFEFCAGRGLVVFVHAYHPCHSGHFDSVALDMAVSFPLEISFAASGLAISETIQRLDDLRVLLSHGGGGVLHAIARAEWVWQRDETLRDRLVRSPLEQLRRFWYDSVVFSGDELADLVNLAGANRVVVGSDFPFIRRPIGEDVRNAPIDDLIRRSVFGTNALELLGGR